jgi:hypothetical protein
MVRMERVVIVKTNLTHSQTTTILADTVTSRVSTPPEIGIIEFTM